MMYDELIKSIHCCFGFDSMQTDCENCMMEDKREEHNYVGCCDALGLAAADAIEQLTADLERSKEYEAFWEEKANEALRKFQLAVANKPNWIPVTERLPEEMDRSCGGWSAEIRPSDDMLVWLSSEKRQSVAWYSHTYNEWTTVDENTVYCFGEVTHWRALSQPPKEE